jgi:putative cardiolipin synthase
MIPFPRFISSLLLAGLITHSALVPATAQPFQGLTGKVDAAFDEIAGERGGAPEAHVRLLTDNMDSWYARWHIIEGARKSIDVTYFIIENDVFGRSFLGLLYKKAQEGVSVRLMVDARGTKTLARTWLGQDILQELVALPNVAIKVYNPVAKALLRIPEEYRSAIASNHDKLIIVDGEWLITGGRNISRHYFACIEDEKDAYRDTDVLIQGGTAPASAKVAFDEEWVKKSNTEIGPDWMGNWVSRRLDLELARRSMHSHMLGLDPVKELQASGKFTKKLDYVQAELAPFVHLKNFHGFTPFRGERPYPTVILDKHSLWEDGRNDISKALAKFCDAAEKEILIQNPYVVLTEGAKAALKRASDRGVDIIINTNSPESTDSLLTQVMFVREWKQLLHDIPKLRIYALEGNNKLHAKVFVVDRQVSLVGTYNMDYLSEQINSEDVAVIKGTAFAGMNYHRIMGDVKRSHEYKIKVTNGKIEQLFGPSDHVENKAMQWVERLSWLAFLRPLI